ncbi:MAG TPA: glycoside hydrolase family 172 protein, partial [Chthonomonadales bacterium]|nr:glycoside hydrolase family 172 protein [Chthonomonadales bacterium]
SIVLSHLQLCLWLAAAGCAATLGDLARPQQGRSMRASSTFRKGADGAYDANADPQGDLDESSNRDNFRIAPGATHVLLDAAGPGVITHIWLTFLGPEPHPWARNGSANHQEMLLRIYWDDQESPGVEAPVGDFFASCFGKRSEVVSLPVVVARGSAYNCFWHMPFRKAARIEILNQGDKPISLLYYNVDWIKKDSISPDTPYFYARYRQEYPCRKGEDYVILDTRGKGHFVGAVLAVRTRSPAWFGEGDEKIYIDGESKPSIWGTGTEDYFLSAWGLIKLNTPYFGVPYFDQWGIVGCHTSAYRWHVNDPIVFNSAIRVTFEHFGWISPDENPDNKSMSWNEREDDYASVAFWYQTGEPVFMEAVPDASARALPSLDHFVLGAEEVVSASRCSNGSASIRQTEAGAHAVYEPAEQGGAWMEITFRIQNSEPSRLLFNAAKSNRCGKLRVLLNGCKLVDEVDLYSAEAEYSEVHLLDFWPEPGEYVLRLEGTGKNAVSEGQDIGIESIRLRGRRPRVKARAWDKGKDWREAPVLYS